MSITTTDVRVNDLVINKLNQEQYDSIAQVSDTEFYIIESDPNISYSEQAYILPTATGSLAGTIYQYIGSTDQYYTNGYFYKCIEDPNNLGTYIWSNIAVQDSATGTSVQVTLEAINWMGNIQSVSIPSVTANSTIIVGPDPSSIADWIAAGIICSSQTAGALEFTCGTTPSVDVVVNIVIF